MWVCSGDITLPCGTTEHTLARFLRSTKNPSAQYGPAVVQSAEMITESAYSVAGGTKLSIRKNFPTMSY